MTDWKPTKKALEIAEKLPEDLRQPFFDLCREYQAATLAHTGRAMYSPPILAELTRWGWQIKDEA